jgi:mannose-6-phosphate isomerase-like protein (cupin superfamily)
MKIKLIKEKKEGKNYQADGFIIYYRYKGTIAGDNSENVEEVIYLITGSAEITLRKKTWKVEAPVKIEFPAKTYHKIKALTDIAFILFEK